MRNLIKTSGWLVSLAIFTASLEGSQSEKQFPVTLECRAILSNLSPEHQRFFHDQVHQIETLGAALKVQGAAFEFRLNGLVPTLVYSQKGPHLLNQTALDLRTRPLPVELISAPGLFSAYGQSSWNAAYFRASTDAPDTNLEIKGTSEQDWMRKHWDAPMRGIALGHDFALKFDPRSPLFGHEVGHSDNDARRTTKTLPTEFNIRIKLDRNLQQQLGEPHLDAEEVLNSFYDLRRLLKEFENQKIEFPVGVLNNQEARYAGRSPTTLQEKLVLLRAHLENLKLKAYQLYYSLSNISDPQILFSPKDNEYLAEVKARIDFSNSVLAGNKNLHGDVIVLIPSVEDNIQAAGKTLRRATLFAAGVTNFASALLDFLLEINDGRRSPADIDKLLSLLKKIDESHLYSENDHMSYDRTRTQLVSPK